MGLLDFLKPKPKTFQKVETVSSENPECDIQQTHIVAALFKVPRNQRDGQWRQEFYEHVASASFACATPQTLTGPDGFTYFILRTPQANKPFESFCIRNMKNDFLLERGWGVVFNPGADNKTDWVFTYGDIVNLHLTGHFATAVDENDFQNIEFTKNVGRTKKEEQVMVAQPSEAYLPKATRAVLRSFLQSRGIKSPKVLMLSSYSNDKVIRKLAFNIPPENYPVTTELDYLMQLVGWFLPNDYILVPLSESHSLARDFYAL